MVVAEGAVTGSGGLGGTAGAAAVVVVRTREVELVSSGWVVTGAGWVVVVDLGTVVEVGAGVPAVPGAPTVVGVLGVVTVELVDVGV